MFYVNFYAIRKSSYVETWAAKVCFYLWIHDLDIFVYPLQVGYDVLMADFFIERNLPRDERIVSTVPGQMFMACIFGIVSWWAFSTSYCCYLKCSFTDASVSAVKLFTLLPSYLLCFLIKRMNWKKHNPLRCMCNIHMIL